MLSENNPITHSQVPGPLEPDLPLAGEEALSVEAEELQEGWGHQAKKLCCEGYNNSHKEQELKRGRDKSKTELCTQWLKRPM